MSIRINKNKCVGCKRCLDVCPGSLIKTDATGKAYIKYPKDCWGCTSCLKECKTGAIAFFLGADIGGMGSEMTVNESNYEKQVITYFIISNKSSKSREFFYTPKFNIRLPNW